MLEEEGKPIFRITPLDDNNSDNSSNSSSGGVIVGTSASQAFQELLNRINAVRTKEGGATALPPINFFRGQHTGMMP